MSDFDKEEERNRLMLHIAEQANADIATEETRLGLVTNVLTSAAYWVGTMVILILLSVHADWGDKLAALGSGGVVVAACVFTKREAKKWSADRIKGHLTLRQLALDNRSK